MSTPSQKLKSSDKPLGYKEKRHRVLMLLPKHGFRVAPAAIEAGFSESYARKRLPTILNKDVEFKAQLDRIREQDCRYQQDKVEAVDTKLRNILDDQDISVSLRLKAIELFYRRHGLLTDKQVIESSDRQRELTDTQRTEARKLALHLMRSKGEGIGKPQANAG